MRQLRIGPLTTHRTLCIMLSMSNGTQNQTRQCDWCGDDFTPQHPDDTCCSWTCADSVDDHNHTDTDDSDQGNN